MIRLVIGRRGMGKTTLSYFVSLQSQCRMVFDPRGMVRSPQSTVSQTVRETQAGADLLIDGEITELVVTPAANVERNFEAFCNEAARVLRANPHRLLAVMIDEVRFVDLTNESLDWIMRTSNVDRVQVLFTGHRPKDIPTDIRAIADTWSLFQFTLRRDLDVIAEQCSDAVSQQVQRLQARHFIEWNDQTGTARYFSDPSRWYVKLRMAGEDGESIATAPPALDAIADPKPPRATLWDD
jgi:hypothetical protein